MKKINEIFYSLQGEGYYTGTAAVFLRFSGCNLKCDFCDTQHETGEWMDDAAIVRKLCAFPARHLVLTGGEPSLFIDDNFIRLLKAHGFYVQIETNGTRPLPEGIDWITCSPKEHLLLTSAHELKVVYQGQSLAQYDHFDSRYKYLQPCSMQNTAEVIEYVKAHPSWRLSVQIHKVLQIK